MRKHTITALAAALCMLCAGIPMTSVPDRLTSVSAAEETLTYGSLSYTVENGNITISVCDKTAESVEIPAEIDGMPVTKIGATAFYGCALTEITIPEGVTSIGSGAFWHSKNLSKITLPSTLTAIESYAFNDCQALEEIDIPESVTYIGNAALGDTPWIAAQKEESSYVIVNGILIDAYQAVEEARAALAAEKERAAQEAEEAAIWKRAGILTNQIGYFPELAKKATLLTEAAEPVSFELLDADDNAVYTGISTPFGLDADSGDTVQVLDFSAFTEEGTYTLRAETGETSRKFSIGIREAYSGLLYDALNYFYQSRSGMEIERQYITSGDTEALARAAGHAPDTATIQNLWGYEASSGTQDVTGGWYDAGDHGKYVVNGGISLWLMQNQYERAQLHGTSAAYQDGAMQLPENANGLPDLLDEARYEMEWMLKMIVQDGECADMAYHKVHDAKWTALGTTPANDKQPRILMPPSTAATLNLAACGAQSYRLWKELDADFAEECLNAARNAYAAAKAHPEMYAPFTEYGGGGSYGDDNVTDEFYWAACELYAATGDSSYYEDLQNSAWAFTVPHELNGGEANGLTGSFDWGNTAALGSLTLLLQEDVLTEQEQTALQTSLTESADFYVQTEQSQGYGLPYKANADGYVWASNSFVADNAIILAYAYDLNQNADYLNGVANAMDYLLVRNAMDYSYVTGYGVHSAQYPHHRFWAKSLNASLPKAPCGVLVGGPNTGLEDDVVKKTTWKEDGTAPQKYYLDDIEAYSVNECTINWNTPLAWVTSYLCEQNGGIAVSQPSAGVQIPEQKAPAEQSADTPDEIVITVPENVTSIGEQIFGKDKDYVTAVILPEGLRSISKEAFYRCSHLETLQIPETLEQVGDNAFAGTPWLTKILADSSLLIMNGMLIDGTAAEGDVEIPEGVTSILGSAFAQNTAITSVKLPEGILHIGRSAFYGCEALAAVNLPESLEVIEQSAFAGTALTELTIPAGVREIGAEAFVNCLSLPEVTVESTDVLIGEEAFGCTSTFTATGQYAYIFVHRVLSDFIVRCIPDSTAAVYAEATGVQVVYTGAQVMLGDLNNDSQINAEDAALLLVAAANNGSGNPSSLDEAQELAADVDASGEMNAADAAYILQYAAYIGVGGEDSFNTFMQAVTTADEVQQS